MQEALESTLNGENPSRETALGINTKSSPTSDTQNAALAQKTRALRADRYRLQNVAARLCHAKGAKQVKNKILEFADDFHRICKCRRTRIAPQAQILKSNTNGKAFYAGLAVCGSVWVCPVCCAKIQERRREEISQAIEYAYSNDKKAVMITFTFPHYHFQTCKELLAKQAEALKILRKGRSYDLFKKRIGYFGLIRSLEVMTGKNGWHPHTHELFFVDKKASASHIKKFLLGRWEKACKQAGLIPRGKIRDFRKYAVDVKDQASNSDYLAKMDDEKHWGADRELAGSSKKRGKGVHPFELLTKYSEENNITAGAKFMEYVEAFHGKRQIFWSAGLKALVGVTQKTDKEVSEESKDKADVLASLEQFAWSVVVAKNAQAELLDLAELRGYDGVYEWLVANGVSDYGGYLDGSPIVPTKCLQDMG